MRRLLILTFLFSTVFFVDMQGQNRPAAAANPNKPRTRILFILDASNSMYARLDNDNRMNAAKRILTRLVDSLRYVNAVEVALRVYGNRSPVGAQDCKDSHLEVGFSPANHQTIIDFIPSIRPRGTTLIAYSLLQAADDFPVEPNVRNIIILITDGLEECKGDPCAVSEALQRKVVILKPFIIGVGSTDDFKRAFECVGRYYDANTEESLNNILNVVISQAINATTAQVNLLDTYGRPNESNVGMTFYDDYSGRMLYNYEHTINDRGNPDTLVLDPSYKYHLVVHTLPPVSKRGIEVAAGKHTTIGLDAPQGEIQLKVEGITAYNNLQCVVSVSENPKIIFAQPFNTTKRYLVGRYDLEVLTLPRIILKNVEVAQSKITTIEIQQPGKLSLISDQDVYGDIFLNSGNRLEWVSNLNQFARREIIPLQPGNYKIVFRNKSSTKVVYTFERDFTITSGGSTIVKLQ